MAATETATPPTVSVLVSVYNGERWLAQALESALGQTFPDFEVVVVDDGSTDGSASIVESFAERDERVRLVRTTHAGLVSARSASLLEARGRFVAFLDHDDEWLPVRLERQLPHVDEQTVVFSDAQVAEGDEPADHRWSEWFPAPALQYPATGLFPHLLDVPFIPMLTVLAPRDLLLRAGAFRHGELHGFRTGGVEDYEMWLLLALRGARFHYVDEPLAVYRLHAGQLSANRLLMAEGGIAVYGSLMSEARGENRRLLRRARQRDRRRSEVALRKDGWRQILSGDVRAARRTLAGSLRIRPQSYRAWLALVLTLCPPLARRTVRGRV